MKRHIYVMIATAISFGAVFLYGRSHTNKETVFSVIEIGNFQKLNATPIVSIRNLKSERYTENKTTISHSLVIPRLSTGSAKGHTVNKESYLWPNQFYLFMPISPHLEEGWSEFSNIMLRSLLFFFPKRKTNLIILADYEMKDAMVLKQRCLNATSQFNDTRFVFNRPSLVYQKSSDMTDWIAKTHTNGWYRQQWLIFWADNFTTARYVGFIDTDNVFTHVPLPGDVFVADKPVLFVIYYDHWNPIHDGFYRQAVWILKRPINFYCGGGIQIYKVSHIQNFRSHVTKLHNSTAFDTVFRQLIGTAFAEYIMLCNYVWFYHREEYTWSIFPMTRNDKTMKNREKAAKELGVSASVLYDKLRISQNYGVRDVKQIPVPELMRIGYCFYMDGKTVGKKCTKIMKIHIWFYRDHIWIERKKKIKQLGYAHTWDHKELMTLGLM